VEPQRIFTVDEANALISELERVFQELTGHRERLDERMDRIKILDVLWGNRIQNPGNPDREEFLSERAGVRDVIREIEEVVRERILELGLVFPGGGLEHGLVDFPTTLDGRVVLLCWRYGEPRIEAWHEVDGGYRGRRPLTPELAARMGRGAGEEDPQRDGQ
jgi:hypothetical protein